MLLSTLALSSALFALSTAQAGAGTAYPGEELLIRDPGVYGPALEVVHLYWDQFPTGIAVSKDGRRFSNFPGALDPNNTYRGTEPKYTIAELMPNNTERAFPSVEMNSPVSFSFRGVGFCLFEEFANLGRSMLYICLSIKVVTGQPGRTSRCDFLARRRKADLASATDQAALSTIRRIPRPEPTTRITLLALNPL